MSEAMSKIVEGKYDIIGFDPRCVFYMVNIEDAVEP